MIRRDIDKSARLVISQELAVGLTRVRDDADLRGDLGADNAGLIRLRHAMEPAFGIKLSDADLAFAATVGTLCDLIETKLENRRVM
jgi:acyl carrier protein